MNVMLYILLGLRSCEVSVVEAVVHFSILRVKVTVVLLDALTKGGLSGISETEQENLSLFDIWCATTVIHCRFVTKHDLKKTCTLNFFCEH